MFVWLRVLSMLCAWRAWTLALPRPETTASLRLCLPLPITIAITITITITPLSLLFSPARASRSSRSRRTRGFAGRRGARKSAGPRRPSRRPTACAGAEGREGQRGGCKRGVHLCRVDVSGGLISSQQRRRRQQHARAHAARARFFRAARGAPTLSAIALPRCGPHDGGMLPTIQPSSPRELHCWPYTHGRHGRRALHDDEDVPRWLINLNGFADHVPCTASRLKPSLQTHSTGWPPAIWRAWSGQTPACPRPSHLLHRGRGGVKTTPYFQC